MPELTELAGLAWAEDRASRAAAAAALRQQLSLFDDQQKAERAAQAAKARATALGRIGPCRNVRDERLAQALADGRHQTDAWMIATGTDNRGSAGACASRLLSSARGDLIRRRVTEILDERAAIQAQATAAAVADAKLSKDWVLGMLKSNAIVGASEGDLAASNNALKLIGNELGMFVEKREIKDTTDEMSEEEKRAALLDLGRDLGILPRDDPDSEAG